MSGRLFFHAEVIAHKFSRKPAIDFESDQFARHRPLLDASRQRVCNGASGYGNRGRISGSVLSGAIRLHEPSQGSTIFKTTVVEVCNRLTEENFKDPRHPMSWSHFVAENNLLFGSPALEIALQKSSSVFLVLFSTNPQKYFANLGHASSLSVCNLQQLLLEFSRNSES